MNVQWASGNASTNTSNLKKDLMLNDGVDLFLQQSIWLIDPIDLVAAKS